MLLFNIRWVNDLGGGGLIPPPPQSPQKCCSSPSPAGQSLAPAWAEVLWLWSPPEGFGFAAAESLPDDASRGPHPAQLLLCSWWGTQQVLPPRCCQLFAEPPEKLGWRTRGCPRPLKAHCPSGCRLESPLAPALWGHGHRVPPGAPSLWLGELSWRGGTGLPMAGSVGLCPPPNFSLLSKQAAASLLAGSGGRGHFWGLCPAVGPPHLPPGG